MIKLPISTLNRFKDVEHVLLILNSSMHAFTMNDVLNGLLNMSNSSNELLYGIYEKKNDFGTECDRKRRKDYK